MIKDPGSEFCLFATGMIEERIINDEYICTIFICEIFDFIVNNSRCQHRSKSKPVGFCGIQEKIKAVFWKIFFERSGTLLHIHVSFDKDIAQLIFQKGNGRETILLGSVTLLQKLSNFVRRKKSLNTIKNSYLFIISLRYNGHGINPPK